MSAQVNEAHRKLVAAIIRDLSIDDGAQLIADSEARAVDHTWRAERDELRAQVFNLEAEVATLTAECDQLRAENERLKDGGVQRIKDTLATTLDARDAARARAERAEAELATAKERLRSEAMDDYAAIKDLQRELAAERGKLDWVFQNCKVEANDYSTGNRDVYYVHDREDLGVAMTEDAK